MGHVLIVGQICYDINIAGEMLLGGPANYQVPVFSAFGWDITVLTRVASNYPLSQLGHSEIINLESDVTTTFIYQKAPHKDIEDRILIAETIASSFSIDEIQKYLDRYDEDEFDLIIFSGITSEFDSSFMKAITSRFPRARSVLDLQSITRSFDDRGKMTITPLSQEDYIEIFQFITIIKGSTVELGENFKISGTWDSICEEFSDQDNIPLLVETTGSGRIFLYSNQITTLELSILEDDKIVDATGSGDIFLASLSQFLSEGKDLVAAIRFAHLITKEHLKISGIPKRSETQNIIDQLLV